MERRSGPAVEWCRDACALARWTPDPVFGGGQWNCPHRFGVDFGAAVVDGVPRCPHLKRRGMEVIR